MNCQSQSNSPFQKGGSFWSARVGLSHRVLAVEDEALLAELAPYEAAKSAIRLPFDKPVPYELIAKLVKIRVAQNLEKAEGKRKM
jgi:uncharacterized protein YdhG (YjbR/CyaY superfamily)